MTERTNEAAVRFVYGFGRTKHIYERTETARNFFGGGTFDTDIGLCGAAGGYPTAEPHRPTCRRCLKMADTASPNPEPPTGDGEREGVGGIDRQSTCEDHSKCCTYRLCSHPKCCGYALPSTRPAANQEPGA